MVEIHKLTPVMQSILESLEKCPKTDSELMELIPNFSLGLLEKLRDLYAIDHNGHLIYITSIGENLLNNTKPKT